MALRLYLIVSGLAFLMVSILHLCRLLFQLPITVGTVVIPQWLSYFGFPAALGYALWAAWLFFSKPGHPKQVVS
ncbi:MAG: hypothetical protein GYA46_07645 [candidate division Zixibacteria bacterium]|nr:hypothetical protein [candidate division Zixibacteria bacterium]